MLLPETTQEQREAKLAVWRDDPLRWLHDLWPNVSLSGVQAEIMQSVRDNRMTFVPSAAEQGKDWIAARIILWFFTTRFPAKVVATSASQRQLEAVLWGEIDRALRTCRVPLGLESKHGMLDVLDQHGRPYKDHWVRAWVARDVSAFQGVHLPHENIPRVLFVFDEATGAPDDFFSAAESQAHRILAIGNPIKTSGFFYTNCKAGDMEGDGYKAKLDRKVMFLDGKESPNVVAGMLHKQNDKPGQPPTIIPGLLSYADYCYRDRVWDEYNRTTRLHGRFYEGDDLQLFPMEWLDQAEAVWEDVGNIPREQRGPFSLGVDVAAGGADRSAWAVVDHLGLYRCWSKHTPDTTRCLRSTQAAMAEYEIPGRRVAVDAGGGGQQAVVDPLRKIGIRVRGVAFGGAPRQKKAYRNARAEMYATLSGLLNPAHWVRTDEGWTRCFAFPMFRNRNEIELLREELSVIPRSYDDEGRLLLPPKDKPRTVKSDVLTLRSLLGRSPDRADALALAAWARVAGSKRVPRVDRPLVATGAGTPPQGRTEQSEKEAGERPASLSTRLFGYDSTTRGGRR